MITGNFWDGMPSLSKTCNNVSRETSKKPIDNINQYVYNKVSFFSGGFIMNKVTKIKDTIDTFSVYQIILCAGYCKTIAKDLESIAYEIEEDHREYNTPIMNFLSFFCFLNSIKKGGDLDSLCDSLDLSDFVKSEIQDKIQSVKLVDYSKVFDLFN